jgi:aminoglycoside 3-N-acetyltransferase
VIAEAELRAQLHALGLAAGSIVVVHTSFKAVGPVAGGPLGLIAALRAALGDEGTLVMPSMSFDDDLVFDARATPCREMGVVADTFWRQPGVARTDNPSGFAAAGAYAATIVASHPLAPPHGIDSPVGRACALGGFVLLLGVGHDADTTLHFAESLAKVPYRETDHCCQGFARADEWLRARGLQREGTVGRGHARLVRAHDVVRVVVAELRRDPFALLAHAADGGCDDCAQAWASVR